MIFVSNIGLVIIGFVVLSKVLTSLSWLLPVIAYLRMAAIDTFPFYTHVISPLRVESIPPLPSTPLEFGLAYYFFDK